LEAYESISYLHVREAWPLTTCPVESVAVAVMVIAPGAPAVQVAVDDVPDNGETVTEGSSVVQVATCDAAVTAGHSESPSTCRVDVKSCELPFGISLWSALALRGDTLSPIIRPHFVESPPPQDSIASNIASRNAARQTFRSMRN
jgi:hypothetical protein